MVPNPKLKLMDQAREVMRLKHYAIRTETCYCGWIRPYNRGSVYLPGALDREYLDAAREWRWQYIFPARDLSKDPRSGAIRRHHLDEVTIHRAIKGAVARVGIAKRVSSHTFRHVALAEAVAAVGIGARPWLRRKGRCSSLAWTGTLRPRCALGLSWRFFRPHAPSNGGGTLLLGRFLLR